MLKWRTTLYVLEMAPLPLPHIIYSRSFYPSIQSDTKYNEAGAVLCKLRGIMSIISSVSASSLQ
jgi:hypothetical protein